MGPLGAAANTCDIWYGLTHLSLLFTSMLKHSHVPEQMLVTTTDYSNPQEQEKQGSTTG